MTIYLTLTIIHTGRHIADTLFSAIVVGAAADAADAVITQIALNVRQSKVNVDLYSALSCTSSKALRYGRRSQGISQFYLYTPRTSATE